MDEVKIYGDKKDTLPEDGWFHTCLYCNEITASTKIYISTKYSKDHRFTVFICPNCKKKVKEDDFAKKCEIYIANHQLIRNHERPATYYLTHPLKKFRSLLNQAQQSETNVVLSQRNNLPS